MMRAKAATRTLLPGWALLGALAASAAGCAGGTWIESPSEAELPLERPARGYPTALRGAKATVSDQSDAAEPASSTAAVHQAAEPSQTQQSPPRQLPRGQQPHAPVTALAVLPPQFQGQLAASASTSKASEHVATQLTGQANEFLSPALQSASAAEYFALTNSTNAITTPSANPPAVETSAVSITAPGSSSGEVTKITTEQESTSDRLAKLDRIRGELIATLEAEIRRRRSENANDEQLPKLEQDLRLVYLSAGRLDDAVTAVQSLDESQREAYKHLMFGLGVWLSPDESRRATLRATKVLQSLREATTELSAGSKLELRKLAFCERVDYFGWYTELPRNEFQAKQQVILYTEIDNFTAERKGATAFETELIGKYQIFDASEQIVAERQLPTDKEVCRNYRRDYFLAYRIYMPDNISPGRYRLELTVEDLKARGKYQGRKFGEGMIEFTIR
jgi:hypothetical protein